MEKQRNTSERPVSEVKARLLQFLRHIRLSQVDFTRIMGVSSTYIGAMRKSLSTDKLRLLTQKFPDLNTEWLLYGTGTMLKSQAPLQLHTPHQDPRVPLLPVSAYAGCLSEWSAGVGERDCEKVISPVHGAEFAIRVNGDSMYPDYRDGNLLFIRKINDSGFIPWGSAMVLDTENGVLVKNVLPDNSDPETLEARSINPAYPTLHIPKRSVFGLYRILATLSLNF